MLLRIKKKHFYISCGKYEPPSHSTWLCFFSSSLFIYFKKGIGNFYNKLCNWYNHETYKICRYLQQNECKAKIRSDPHGDSFRGFLMSWTVDTLYTTLARDDLI
jgi:hypothetical protein